MSRYTGQYHSLNYLDDILPHQCLLLQLFGLFVQLSCLKCSFQSQLNLIFFLGYLDLGLLNRNFHGSRAFGGFRIALGLKNFVYSLNFVDKTLTLEVVGFITSLSVFFDAATAFLPLLVVRLTFLFSIWFLVLTIS